MEKVLQILFVDFADWSNLLSRCILPIYIATFKYYNMYVIRLICMIEWCFTPLSTVFQSYHGDSSQYSCHSWVSPVLGWALKCLAQGHSHEKTQRIQCGSNPGPLDCESNTLQMSHGSV